LALNKHDEEGFIAMKIKQVTIHNWRSIRHIEIDFQDLMIFIGQNNHGKSNILTAILFFFGQLSHGELDFNEGSSDLYVEITFAELDEHDNKTFKKYVSSDNTIKVRKEATLDGSSEYHGYLEIPNENWLKESNIGELKKRDIAITLPLSEYLPAKGTITIDAFKEAQERYIKENREDLSFSYELETNKFLGIPNVAKGIWGEVFFIPSVKKASDEFTTKTNTVFSQLYSRVINAMSENSEEFKTAKIQLGNLVRKLNKHTDDGQKNTDRPSELSNFESVLESELKDWDTRIDVEITPPDIDDILKVGTNVWVNDGIRTDIARKGQGLQRALIFALIRTLAKVSKDKKDDEGGSRKASKSTFFILEEPELFLHPQAQRSLFDSLQELSKENQVLLCTHSSSFINLDKYKSICRVIKNNSEKGTEICQCKVDLFPQNDEKKEFNLAYWINPDRSELFFAQKVILVEGPTDKTVIPFLAKKLSVFKYDYTIIDCGSKDSIPQYINLLQYFSIPYVVAYDKDHQDGKNPDAIGSANKASGAIEKKISSHLGSSVIFENDIEEELGIKKGNSKSKPYKALKHITQENFEIENKLQSKIKTIYD